MGEINRSNFDKYSNLNHVTIPEGITAISGQAFSNCVNLTSITIPEGVTSIGNKSFVGCSSLETINYTGTEEQWSVITKGNDWKTNYPSDMVINYNYTGE